MASGEFRSVFWDDLAEDLKDPAFREAYIETSSALAVIDRTVPASDITGQVDD